MIRNFGSGAIEARLQLPAARPRAAPTRGSGDARTGLTVMMVAAVMAAGCGGAEQAAQRIEDDTFVIALTRQPENLNPIAGDNVYEGNLKFFNGLLRYARDLSPQPDLAAALPTRSADGRRVTVKLRTDVTLPRRHAADGEGRRVHLQRDPRPRLGLAAGEPAGLARRGRARSTARRSSSGSIASTRRSTTSSRSGSSPRTCSRARTSRPRRSTAAGRHGPVHDQGVPAGRADRDEGQPATTSAARRRSSASC